MTKDFIDHLIEVVEVNKTIKKSSKEGYQTKKINNFEIAGVQVGNKRLLTEEHKLKISEGNKGKTFSEERRNRIAEARRGVRASDETRKKMSEVRKGKVHPKEVIKKMVETRKRNGYTHSEETRRKMSEINKGRVSPRKGKKLDLTDEQRKNISEKLKGRVVKEETKQKLREILTGRKLSEEMRKYVIEKRRQPVMTPNGEFQSRQALINRLVADGVLNATDKLAEWFKFYPNEYYYTKKKKTQSVYSIEDEREHVLKHDETIKQLLQIIATRFQNGKPLFVTEAMTLRSIASPITINRRMSRMIRLGLIERQFYGANHRTKFLIPTKLSIDNLQSKSNIQKRAKLI